MSDNKEKLKMSDLSSTSSSNENDSKFELLYASIIPANGSEKLTEAQLRKKRRERKINYFLEKYAGINASKISLLSKENFSY